MLPENRKQRVFLNPNHSSFILVDNCSTDEFTVEINFRTNLENKIKGMFKIPMVLIVVEGGVGTLNTIKNALTSETPIILVAVSFFFFFLKHLDSIRYLIQEYKWLC